MEFTLPFPPSINHYWLASGKRRYISKRGRLYRAQVLEITRGCVGLGDARISLSIEAWMPDKRVRDLDNLLKSLLDSLEAAGIYSNDSQVDEIFICRKGVKKGGELKVAICAAT